MIPDHVYEANLRTLFEPIAALLDDSTVSEIMINGPGQVYVERRGRLHATTAQFASDEALMSALRSVAQFVGKRLDAEHPILEGRLPDGSRIEAIIPPAAPDGPMVSIRRFSRETLTADMLVSSGSVDPKAMAVLADAVRSRKNILVSGGTGSGKTSLLNVLSCFVPDDQRLVVIEDARELQLQKAHVVYLEARPADARGRGRVTVRDLFKATLRMRPDRIVVGEIRGAEALELIQAMTSGHGGCLSTIHASRPSDALGRLETLTLMSDVDLPMTALRTQIASAIDLIVQIGRQRDGSRRVTDICAVEGVNSGGGYKLENVL